MSAPEIDHQSPALRGKIAVEEHFVTAELERCIAGVGWEPAAWRRVIERLEDVEEIRIPEMDRLGIDMAGLSLGSDGVQGLLDGDDAVAVSREANDALAEIVARHPDRFFGFAALPMQNPAAAVEELTRSVEQLGFKGVMVNGFSNLGDADFGLYYDAPEYEDLWERMAALGVPFYLHPRNPLPRNSGVYAGRSELLGPTWAFAVETGTHTLRLITSGVFDRHPELRLILGHLGEFLPFAAARLEQRIAHIAHVSLDRPPTEVLRENFHVTISGNYHTPSLRGVIMEMGADRVLFAADYPFEEMADAAVWFDGLDIDQDERDKIGHLNARRLFGLAPAPAIA